MRLGDALSQRADLQRRIAQLAGRLRASVVVQEGDLPPEDPEELVDLLDELGAQLERLVTQINLTNAATRLPSGETLTSALARRDVLALRQGVLRDAAEAVRETQARYSRSEIRLERRIDVVDLQRALDDLARRRRELDTQIQERNWTTDLLDDASR